MPSDRTNLITEIGRRLSREEWPIVGMTLRQFGFQETVNYEGDDRLGYVVFTIESGEDAALLSLTHHLRSWDESPRPHVEPTFWQTDNFRLFVSHLASHREFAGNLKGNLLEFGVSAFVAHDDIEPTRKWQDEIETALKTCDGMLVLLHPGFHESNWTDQEIGYGMGRKLLIVAVRFGHDPYGFIGRLQAMEGQGKGTSDLARELFDILCRHPQTRKRIAESLVTRLEKSESFSCTKRTMDLLDKLQYWDSLLSTRARSAVQSNPQVRDAWRVPNRLEQFIERIEAAPPTSASA